MVEDKDTAQKKTMKETYVELVSRSRVEITDSNARYEGINYAA